MRRAQTKERQRIFRNMSDVGSRRSQASTAASSSGRVSARQLLDNYTARDAYRQPQVSESPASQRYFQPPQRRSSQQSSPQSQAVTPSRTPPGVQMGRPQQRWAPSAFGDGAMSPGTVAVRYRGGGQSQGSQSARGSALGFRDYAESAQGSARVSVRGSQSARDFRDGSESPRPPSSWADVEKTHLQFQGMAPSSRASSDYSGCSTPVAGRTWGHITRTFGNGIGRQHYHGQRQTISHFLKGYVADADEPGFGSRKGPDMEEGGERYIGHGRRWLGGDICHLKASLPQFDSMPGLHGRCRGDDYEGGIMRCCGNGLKKVCRSEVMRHHITDDVESEPGLHGHTKDLDFKDGLPWHVGHGKKKIPQSQSKQTFWDLARRQGAHGATSEHNGEDRAAGMTTRHIALVGMVAEPSRRGTHQDRRHVMALQQGKDPRVPRRDQATSGIELCLPGARFTGLL